MDNQPETLGITLFDRQPHKRQNLGEKRVFTGMIASCQLMLDAESALLEFTLPPQTSPVLVGRANGNTEPKVAVDLSPFNAHNLGVSRAHARFERAGSRLFIRDLGSTNGTWLNGKRLTAMNVYEIYHGDKVEFGRLSSTLFIKS